MSGLFLIRAERDLQCRVDPSHRNVLRRWNHPWHPGNATADTRRREFKTADEVTSNYTETTRDARRRAATRKDNGTLAAEAAC